MATATERPSTRKAGSRRKTRGFEAIAWIEANCVLTQGRWYGQPFKLQRWQKKLILELFEVDQVTALRRYRWAYISVAKKNGKTLLMAALALWFLIGSGEKSPLVVCAAGNDDQADLLFDAAKTMCEVSPTLKAICDTYEAEILVPSIPGAKLQRVAASAKKHGSNLDGKDIYVVICDELHVWEGERGRTVWGTLTRGVGARREPMVLQITTAGFDRGTICYKQYEHAKKCLDDPTYDPAYYAFIVEAAEGDRFDLEATWEKVNPSYGVIMGPEFYRDQITKQPENEFKRFYLNQWTRSQESWLPPGAWDDCRVDGLHIPRGAPIYAAVDVALKHDSTAVAWCWWSEEAKRWVVRSKIWTAGRDLKLDVADAMDHLRALALGHDLVETAYDPRFFEYPATVLEDEGLNMIEFPQTAERMVPVCGNAYELIANAQVAHDGDPGLEDHVLSAAQRPGERGWTLSKGRSKRKIDACIALVIALERGTWHQHNPPSQPFFAAAYGA